MPAGPEPDALPAGIPAPASFLRAARAALQHAPDAVDPWFHGYLADLRTDRGLRTWVRAKQQLMALAGGVQGRVVVDAGSGFGMVANLLAAWGAERVWAIDVHERMVRSHALVNRAHFAELAARVVPLVADSGRLPLPAASADLVTCIEGVSLFYDADAFLDECARVLRPGGWVVISDGHNGANPAVRAQHEELWERLERGPMGRFGEVDVPEPMVSRRERLIRDRFPALAPELVSTLAEHTSCMDRAQITAAVREHLAGGPLPASPYRRGMCPRELEWGYCLEQLFDPRDLAARLTKRGFAAQALPHFGGAANELVNAANTLLRALPTFRWARGYRVVARRH